MEPVYERWYPACHLKQTAASISLEDSFLNLTAREKKALKNSWVQVLADEIFPVIDEKRYRKG